MEVNVKGMFLAAKHAVPAMVATAGGGAVVNVSSIAALRPRGLTVYSASKGAVISLTRAMAVDHGGQGVRVNCVAPGPVYTPMAYGWRAGHERDRAPHARRRLAAQDRRHRLGYRRGGALPALGPLPVDHRAYAHSGWRRHRCAVRKGIPSDGPHSPARRGRPGAGRPGPARAADQPQQGARPQPGRGAGVFRARKLDPLAVQARSAPARVRHPAGRMPGRSPRTNTATTSRSARISASATTISAPSRPRPGASRAALGRSRPRC